MTFRLCLVCLLGAVFAHGAPMTFKELDFLLRQHTPEADILREVAQRRLVAPIEGNTAQNLKASGATEALIAKLNAPGMTLSPEESRAEWQRQQTARQLTIQSLQADARPVPGGAPTPPAPDAKPSQPQDRETVRQMLADKIVRLDGDQLRPVDISTLRDVRIFVFYYGSMAMTDCRKFEPKLMATYQRLKAKYPTQFEVIFLSGARDEFNMGSHMRTVHMPWPAVRFGAAPEGIVQFGKGMPWVVPVSDSGQLLTKNQLGTDRLETLGEILDGVEWLLAKL